MANKKIESLTEIKEAVAATSAVAETKRIFCPSGFEDDYQSAV